MATNPRPLSTPPHHHELEVSLFGSGFGECVVVHIGGGEWIVVDSCYVSNAFKIPVAVRYLEKLGVCLERAVKLVVATHWHNDHIEGAAEMVKRARSAKFMCPGALRTPEFLSFAAISRGFVDPHNTGKDEFKAILNLLSAEVGQRSGARRGPEWAWADQRHYSAPESSDRPPCEVWSLSPSSKVQTLALEDVAALLPELTRQRPAQPRSPNVFSVALLLKVGEASVLLGGDLENSADSGMGWNAILVSPGRPREKACVFKVPHHGSSDADSPAVWDQMLAPAPIAIVTRFGKGRKPLPSKEDVQRLLERTPELYSTGDPSRWKALRRARRARAVEYEMNAPRRRRRPVRGPTGHIQVRWDLRDMSMPPSVHLGYGALKLS